MKNPALMSVAINDLSGVNWYHINGIVSIALSPWSSIQIQPDQLNPLITMLEKIESELAQPRDADDVTRPA